MVGKSGVGPKIADVEAGLRTIDALTFYLGNPKALKDLRALIATYHKAVRDLEIGKDVQKALVEASGERDAARIDRVQAKDMLAEAQKNARAMNAAAEKIEKAALAKIDLAWKEIQASLADIDTKRDEQNKRDRQQSVLAERLDKRRADLDGEKERLEKWAERMRKGAAEG